MISQAATESDFNDNLSTFNVFRRVQTRRRP
jgi:hypothetical protein